MEATIGTFDPAGVKAQLWRQEALADAVWQAVEGAYQALATSIEGTIHSGDQLQKECYLQVWRQWCPNLILMMPTCVQRHCLVTSPAPGVFLSLALDP